MCNLGMYISEVKGCCTLQFLRPLRQVISITTYSFLILLLVLLMAGGQQTEWGHLSEHWCVLQQERKDQIR